MDKKPQILLVDDSKEIVEGLKSYLSRNYMIHTASNGLDALKVFEQTRIGLDLVITDMMIPDISGAALISIIKTTSPGTPIIAMTGWGHYARELATELKADIVLKKPFELEYLDQSVSKLLSQKD